MLQRKEMVDINVFKIQHLHCNKLSVLCLNKIFLCTVTVGILENDSKIQLRMNGS